MKKWIAILALVCLVPAAAMAGEPRAHIDDALTTFVAAFNAGDGATVATVASLYTEDAALYPPGGEPVHGRAAIQTFWQGAIDSGMKIDDLHAVEVDAKGDIAGEVGVFTLSVPGEGGVTKVPGRYIVIWKRSGHTWQLHRDIWNTN
jgi:ketosteroid isomerase-like protein